MKLPRSSFLLLAAGVLLASQAIAQNQPPNPDFTGIWQLNDKASDSAEDITRRLHAEKRREEAPSSRPASASSSGSPASSSNSSGGRGGGHGMGGGGMGGGGMGGGGRHGGGGHDSQDLLSSKTAPKKDPTPPLFSDDALLNVQQTEKGVQVDYNNTDRLDTKFDGVTRQSLSGSAQVQTQLSPDGMHVSMQFEDGTRLDQTWVRSPDGHHLTVTETWTTTEVEMPIVFKRSYDRLDL
ncbi:hypothetical protein ACFFJT_07875 [Dyella flava]|uniref:Uncharacterized protein n=1 Tax=Dyella flava TaxID=1920170 RepID=A0ABS2K9R6_9GAMM|nr:hypothetical protein [Dyella flava]MBM7127510.1 hypothetical protein [Dyella flava]GLQ51109.1 hypothetical protein GCM10010872_25580 [Dyella flava]